MKKHTRKIFIALYLIIIIGVFSYVFISGFSYYSTPKVDRPFHLQYELMKPSGFIGHGLGIVGSLLITFGVVIYIVRKRWKRLFNLGRLKYWLDFHIFLCTLGAGLVIFHTTFKFGGLVSIGLWSMVLVWLSGFIGRIIYVQIPQTIEGRALSLNELQKQKLDLNEELSNKYSIDIKQVNTGKISALRIKNLSKTIQQSEIKQIKKLIQKQKLLSFRINNLHRIQKWFQIWHYVHIPFTIILFTILIIHVCVVLFFGYKWIF